MIWQFSRFLLLAVSGQEIVEFDVIYLPSIAQMLLMTNQIAQFETSFFGEVPKQFKDS